MIYPPLHLLYSATLLNQIANMNLLEIEVLDYAQFKIPKLKQNSICTKNSN